MILKRLKRNSTSLKLKMSTPRKTVRRSPMANISLMSTRLNWAMTHLRIVVMQEASILGVNLGWRVIETILMLKCVLQLFHPYPLLIMLSYQLLHRFYASLHASNPSLLTSAGKRYTIAPPSIHREGNKKSIFANVTDICKRMHRQPEHVIQFLFSEMGTTGSVDGAGRLVIKGRFQQKQVENVLRRYIGVYYPFLRLAALLTV